MGDSKRNSRARWKEGQPVCRGVEVVIKLNNFFPRIQKNVDNFLDGRTGSPRPANGDIRAPLLSQAVTGHGRLANGGLFHATRGIRNSGVTVQWPSPPKPPQAQRGNRAEPMAIGGDLTVCLFAFRVQLNLNTLSLLQTTRVHQHCFIAQLPIPSNMACL